MLTADFLSDSKVAAGASLRSLCGGIRLPATADAPPAMEVSGTPLFRGGGGNESGRLCGRYADAVCSSLFEDARPCIDAEKVRRHVRAAGVEAANLEKAQDDVTLGSARQRDIVPHDRCVQRWY